MVSNVDLLNQITLIEFGLGNIKWISLLTHLDSSNASSENRLILSKVFLSQSVEIIQDVKLLNEAIISPFYRPKIY